MPSTKRWRKVGGVWVSRATAPPDPPPDPTVNTAIHVPNRVILGFANADSGASQLDYATAVSFTGPIYERRKFSGSWVSASFINSWLDTTSAAGQVAWLSFKTIGVITGDGNNAVAWQGVMDGKYDAGLDIVKARAAARSEHWMLTFDHEPTGSGISNADLAKWAGMNAYISNYLAPVNDKLCFATIMNGYPWGPKNYDAAVIAAAYPDSLIATMNANGHLMAVDSYDSADPSQLSYTQYDRTSLKMQGYVDWARAKGVKAAGFGEFGCHTGEDVRRCWNVVAANSDLVEVCNYFNSGANSRANWLLTPSTYQAPDPAFNGTAESQAKLNYYIQAKGYSVNPNPAQIP